MKWISVFLVFLTFGAYAQTPDTGRVPVAGTATGAGSSAAGGAATRWSVLQKDNFSIRYPSTWTPNTEGTGTVNFFILAPLATPDAKFRENVNLVIEDLGADSTMTLDELVKASLDALQSAFAGFELISSHQMTNTRGRYQRFIYKSVQNGYPLEFMQEFQIIRKKAYILTFTASQSKFEEYQELGEKILQSFAMNR